MAGQVCIWAVGKLGYCFLFLVHISLPSTLADEPQLPCQSSNNGEYIRDNSDCAVAYRCSVDENGWLKITCPEGRWFDLNVNYCNTNFMVQCSKECLDNPCIQNGICTELPGGYRCTYPDPLEDMKGPDDLKGLLISQYKSREILHYNPLDRSFTQLTVPGNPNIMKYDSTSNKLYIALEKPDQIVVTRVQQSLDNIDILRSDVLCEGIDVDVNEDLLFYTDYRRGTVNSMSLSTPQHRVLAKRGLTHPRSVVADTSKKKIYWIDLTINRIETADYNGENQETFVKTAFPPRALDIMPGGDKLYWCDNTDEIWEVTQSGQDRSVYKPEGDLLQCDSISVLNGNIYNVYLLSEIIYRRNTTGDLIAAYDGHGQLKNGLYKTIVPITQSTMSR